MINLLYHTNIGLLFRYAGTALAGILASLQPTLPYIGICTVAVFYDCLSAWSLSRRVKKKFPEKSSTDSGKFNSRKAGNVFITLIKIYALIVLAFLVQTYITDGLPVDLTKFAAGAVCFWQIWSILENESSCSSARWAKVAQKILVDKTERHFDIDLSNLNDNEKNK